MKISVIGTGYVGLVSGVCLAEVGHTVVCVDVDAAKVERINRGETPIYEKDLEPMLRRHMGKGLRATTDLRSAVLDSEITFIAVGTPFDGSRIDLRYIREVAREIGATLKDKRDYHVVVVKSTVVPGTTDDVVLPILEQASGRKAGADFGVGMNPEFLTEGVAVADFVEPDRIVLGGMDERSIAALNRVYAPFKDAPVLRTNNKTAEMIKYTSNATLATLISFSNEIGNLCERLGGVDIADVMEGVQLARYFTTVFDDGRRVRAPISSFLWAGCGFGGSCLPKDVKALAAHGEAHGQPMPMLDTVIRINQGQPARVIGLIEKHFPSLKGVRVAVLGLAFKPDTDDMRESPAIPITRMLIERGANVIAYDPIAHDSARAMLPGGIRYATSLDEALANAEVAVLVTRWEEFRRVPEILNGRDRKTLFVDGRRMLDKQQFARYEGIGLRT